MSKKKFIITIDNEEDNQWNHLAKETTENAKYLVRFQELCNKFNLKPVYLTTYHMAKNKSFQELAIDSLKSGQCEVGMHLHAWSTPPDYILKKKTDERSYLIEYPYEVMEEKIKVLNDLLTNSFGEIVTHRSGRWTMDERYFNLLKKYGYKCDCSVTPEMNWSENLGATGIQGSDYSKYSHNSYQTNGIWEVPVTIRKINYFDVNSIHSVKSLLQECSHLIRGKVSWLRPSMCSLYQMKTLLNVVKNLNSDYIMFMIHSSELMPGGSPYYKDEYSIEVLYEEMTKLFEFSQNDFEGCTLKDYISKKESV